MKKRISDMTLADKAAFLESTKKAMEKEQGVPWSWMESRIQAEIDATFDDERFAGMDSDSRIDATLCRKEFGDKKSELVDYLLWTGKFVTHSDVVEW